jgi:Rrf2 family protein
MAQTLGVSEAHLAKVLNRLTRAGLLRSMRGPSGGFSLARPPGEILLLEVYEATEGPLQAPTCLWDTPKCARESCPLGELMHDLNTRLRDFLATTSLANSGLKF